MWEEILYCNLLLLNDAVDIKKLKSSVLNLSFDSAVLPSIGKNEIRVTWLNVYLIWPPDILQHVKQLKIGQIFEEGRKFGSRNCIREKLEQQNHYLKNFKLFWNFFEKQTKVSELNIQLGYLKNEKFLMFRKIEKYYLLSKYFNMSSQIKGKY